MEQLGQGVIAAFKEETGGFAVPPAVATGYRRIPFSRSPGMTMTRADIDESTIRDDGQSENPRKGSKSIRGMFGGAIRVNAWTDFLALAMRSAGPSSGRIIQPAADPVERSITVEQYYKQLDGSKRFRGVRSAGMTFRLTPDGEGFFEFPFLGVDMDIVTGASAPGYSGALLGPPWRPRLVSADAAITIDGVAAVDLTSAEFTLDTRPSDPPVIGSNIKPNIFPNNATGRGRLIGMKKDFLREQDAIAEAEFAVVFTFQEPAGGLGSLAITLPNSKFLDFDEALGEEGALLATIPFSFGTDESGGANPRTMIIVDEETA